MTFIIIFIWTLTAFAQECRGQITVTQSPSITAEQPGGTVNIKCKTSRDVQRWSGVEVGGADGSGAVDGSETVTGPNDGTESAQK
ncbi:unnamed protein product [Leuciscus chuanchicus]